MKRYGYLFDKIASFENLLKAFYKACRGKKYKKSVADFYFNLEPELLTLQKELISNTYKPGEYNTFIVYENKERNICAAPFRDRVVHHAICNVLEPVFERDFIYDTYACRKGKGSHKAIKRAANFTGKSGYFLKCDIRKFFEHVDHVILKKLLREKFKDEELLDLLDKIIDHPVPDRPAGKGIPIGNLTSQFFANYYLSEFDHFIKEILKTKGYVRYMDDFLLFHENKTFLHESLASIRNFLKEKLFLSLKENSFIAPVSEGITFLGFRLFPGTVRIESKKLTRFRRRIKEREKEYINGYIDEDYLVNSVVSMTGHIIHADTLQIRKKIFDHH